MVAIILLRIAAILNAQVAHGFSYLQSAGIVLMLVAIVLPVVEKQDSVGESAKAGFRTIEAATLFAAGATVREIKAFLISQREALDFTPRKA